MAVKLSVGLQKKVGLPNYGSLGASCSVEFEIDRGLLDHDPPGFQEKVRKAFAACQQSIQDQLASQQANPTPNGHHGPGHPANGHSVHGYSLSHGNGHGHTGGQRGNARPATASQARALRAIAGRQRLDLFQLLGHRFQVDRPEELSIAEASSLIHELKAPIERNPN